MSWPWPEPAATTASPAYFTTTGYGDTDTADPGHWVPLTARIEKWMPQALDGQ